MEHIYITKYSNHYLNLVLNNGKMYISLKHSELKKEKEIMKKVTRLGVFDSVMIHIS